MGSQKVFTDKVFFVTSEKSLQLLLLLRLLLRLVSSRVGCSLWHQQAVSPSGSNTHIIAFVKTLQTIIIIVHDGPAKKVL